jgi:Mitogen-activated protein kinase kinase 1 interacting
MDGLSLSTSLEAALASVLQRVEGAEHVIVSNLFGLPVARVSLEDESQITIDPRPIETTLAIVLAKTAEAADKLPLGKCKTATTIASSFVLVQASMAPLVVAVVAKPTVDVPALLALMPALVATLEPLREAAEQ